MHSRKILPIVSTIMLILGVISIIVFLGFKKHIAVGPVLSCTNKGITTAEGNYRFPPQWGLEGTRILLRPEPGGMFDSVYPEGICNGEGRLVDQIKAIEYNGFGYITALDVVYE